jgi:hypothetical protein
MIRILEEIIRDPDTNPTARCTAIRTLREFPQQPEAYASADFYPSTLTPAAAAAAPTTAER